MQVSVGAKHDGGPEWPDGRVEGVGVHVHRHAIRQVLMDQCKKVTESIKCKTLITRGYLDGDVGTIFRAVVGSLGFGGFYDLSRISQQSSNSLNNLK